MKHLFRLTILPFLCALSPAYGQGLIFNLPEDGQGVEYEGTITYVTVRADIAEGKETVVKDRTLSIKSVGTEKAVYDGVEQDCRWIEIKSITGISGERGLDPGPAGSRIYKVLVPESKVIGTASDGDTIPNVVLPIVRGWRRSGEATVRKMNCAAIAFYPTICQLAHYPEPEVIAESDSPMTVDTNLNIMARHLKGTIVTERRESRSTNEAHFWVTDRVPFGLARWEATVTRERKQSTAARTEFQEVITTTSQMSVSRILPVAQTELVIPEDQQ